MQTHSLAATPLTLAPVSDAAAQLLHQVYAEALAQAEASIPRPPEGSIVLVPAAGAPENVRHAELHGLRWLQVYFETGDYRLSTAFQRPSWADEYGGAFEREWLHVPGLWHGQESRRDQQDRRWERQIGPFADDGFGTLVEVPR